MKKIIDTEEFVRLWETVDDLGEIARILGTTRSQLNYMAGFMRKKGVKLRYRRHKLDPVKLNKIIASLLKKGGK